LINFEKAEKAKAERDQAQHQLESAVYDYTYKLEEEEFRKFGSQEELEQISKELAQLREWLEEMPAETGAEEFKAKKQELLKPIRKMKSRKRQKEVSEKNV
jgi:molecular chaperone DnaK (HSP70)